MTKTPTAAAMSLREDSVSPPGPDDNELGLSRVRDWDAAGAGSESPSVASLLCTETVRTFRGVARHLVRRDDLPTSSRHALKQSFDILALWAMGYGVREGDLDEALAASWSLQRSVLEVLVSVGTTLSRKLIPFLEKQGTAVDVEPLPLNKAVADASEVLSEGRRMRQPRRGAARDTASDSSSDDLSASETDGLHDIVEDIDVAVQCLLDLGPLIRAPADDCTTVEAPYSEVAVATVDPHQIFAEIISHRYPRAQKNLVDRLSRANLCRFLRLQRQRAENTEAAQSQTVDKGDDGATRFNDSGIGTSRHTSSSYAETLMSYHQRDSPSVKVPPLSDEARRGIPFECVACGGKLTIKHNSLWKNHLFTDLRPWICHDTTCPRGDEPFESRHEWIGHLADEHDVVDSSATVVCPLCQESVRGSKQDMIDHLAAHMEEISLSALPAEIGPDEEASAADLFGTSTVAPNQPRRKPISDDEWDAHKEEIRSMYGNLPLKEVRDQLERIGFSVSENQLEYRCTVKWGFDKDDFAKNYFAAADTYPGLSQAPAYDRDDSIQMFGDQSAGATEDRVVIEKPGDVPIKLTPIIGRVSRAKKGVPVHVCDECRPAKVFTRVEHLRRHQLSHQDPAYTCTHPGCDRAFHRQDLLSRHLQRHKLEAEKKE